MYILLQSNKTQWVVITVHRITCKQSLIKRGKIHDNGTKQTESDEKKGVYDKRPQISITLSTGSA